LLPNLITGLRFLLLLPLYLCLTQGDNPERWAALGLYVFAGLTDVLDGRIARSLGQATSLGHLLDRMADVLLTLTAVIGLLVNGTIRDWTAAAALVVIGREVAHPRPHAVEVDWLERVKIALQFIGLGLMMAPWAPGLDSHAAGGWVFIACAGLTLMTLVGPLVSVFRTVRPAQT
jgi:cardiolipin synthase